MRYYPKIQKKEKFQKISIWFVFEVTKMPKMGLFCVKNNKNGIFNI